MEARRFVFGEDWGGPPPFLSIDCWPAHPDVNPIFAAVSAATLHPHKLAIQMGRISDQTIARIWAHLFAEAVIIGSPDPIYERFDRERWRDWLIEHPIHADALRRFCEVRRNFETEDERDQREQRAQVYREPTAIGPSDDEADPATDDEGDTDGDGTDRHATA